MAIVWGDGRYLKIVEKGCSAGTGFAGTLYLRAIKNSVFRIQKMLNMNSFRVTLLASAVAVLTACGGGGGGTTTPVVTTPPPPVTAAASLITTVGPSTYTGEFAIAYNLINAERSRCGFGLLSQNAQLDAAASAHARYLATSATAADTDAHAEVAGRAGFTGVTVTERVTAAGYNVGTVTEVAAVGKGINAVRGLLSAPYHLAGLMRSYRDIGIGMQASIYPELPYFIANVGYQRVAAPQLLGSNDVSIYPCAGTTGVRPALYGETPNPVPGRDLQANPIGTSIYVRVRDGNTLVITNSGMLKVATGASIPMRTATMATNDPNKRLEINEGFVSPDVALEVNTDYQVTVNGTNSGTPFSRTFQFKTGLNFDN